ncbi:DUF2752 domain-containing protein [Flavobacterium sp. RHBU_24]|uniref:DUF2752 domain-containing protein n=1 Tax=Flavobacterium sp. RHBU_24 TaxID=3391185 RepID=UPI00398567DD
MSRSRLYLLLGTLTIVGYVYLAYSLFSHNHSGITVCPIKNITGIPCPSCGTTRAVIAIIYGHFSKAAFINPLGYLAAAFMAVLPLWLLHDLILQKDTLRVSYATMENYIKGSKLIIVVAACLMLTNWIWNIYKGL